MNKLFFVSAVAVLSMLCQACAGSDSPAEKPTSSAKLRSLEGQLATALHRRGIVGSDVDVDAECVRDPGGEPVSRCTAKWTRSGMSGVAVAERKDDAKELTIVSHNEFPAEPDLSTWDS